MLKNKLTCVNLKLYTKELLTTNFYFRTQTSTGHQHWQLNQIQLRLLSN